MTKKIFRLDLLVEWLLEWLRSSVDECDSCPIASACFELDDDEILCDRKRAEEFKQAIIERFSTDVEVVEDDGYAQAIIDRFSTEVEVEQ